MCHPILFKKSGENMSSVTNEKKYSLKTYLRFILLSGFGVFAFFINFSLPKISFNLFGYQVVLIARRTFLVDHLTRDVLIILKPIMPYVALLFGVLGVLDLVKNKERNFKTKIQTAFSCARVFGLIVLIMCVFGFGPTIFRASNTGLLAMNNIFISYIISIPVAAAFLPLLLDYGLVDFFSALTRPLMRPVFKLPGRAAVISVSAFLGNFSLGHIAINEEYQAGRMTNKECQIIGTCLSTVSIGFMILIANNTGIISHWNFFFWTTYFITLFVTFICIRLKPLKLIPNEYMSNVTPNPEIEYNDHLLKNAWISALDTAKNSDPFYKRLWHMLGNSGYILVAAGNITMTFAVLGAILSNYTPIFTWIGYIFYPIMRLVGISAAETHAASTSAILSFIDATLPSLTIVAGEWSMRVRYMIAVLPISSIIFLGSFVPTIMATKVPVKFSHLCILWVERVFLTILITGIIGLIFF